MSLLSLFGLCAVTLMLVFYALVNCSHWFIFGFSIACGLGSIYGFLQGAWPFGIDVAEELGIDVQNAAPLRNSLIKKGMIDSPKHGDTAFTVPLFKGFLKRMMLNFPNPNT